MNCWRITRLLLALALIAHAAADDDDDVVPYQGLCDDCKLVNGIGYNPYPPDCTRYVQCQPLGKGKYVIHIRSCAHGTHWNHNILTCDKPKEAGCQYATTTSTTTTTTTPATTTTTPMTTTTTPKTTTTAPMTTTITPMTTSTTPMTTTTTPMTTTTTPMTTTTTPKTTTTTPKTTTTAPMTTTTTPMTTTTLTTTTKKPDPGLCDKCKLVNGIGYNPYPRDCTRYVQCQPIGKGKYVIHIRSCAHGTHWNHNILTCDKPKEAGCQYDKCQDYGVEHYVGESGCRSYWQCQGSVSVGLCCPWGQAFVPEKGCVPSNFCRDPCGAPTYPVVCEKKPVYGKPNQYLEKVWSVWVARFCARGTLFNQGDCQCSLFGSHDFPPAPVCKPEIYLPFNNSVQDESGNRNNIHNEGVKVINGVAYFDGKSSLRVPRFSNAELGSTLVVRLRFREAVSSPGRVALINNGDCNVDGTLFVAKDTDAVSMGVKNTAGTVYTVSLPCQSGDWKTAEMIYDAGALRGTLEGKSSAVPAKGKISTSKHALQIGRGEGFHNFHGYMDEIAVYLCRSL